MRVLGAFRPADRCLRVATAFLAAARRLRVRAAFCPAVLRLGLMCLLRHDQFHGTAIKPMSGRDARIADVWSWRRERKSPAGSGAFACGSALGLGRGSLCGGTCDRRLCAEPILLSRRFLIHYNELQYDSHRGDAPYGGRRVAAGGRRSSSICSRIGRGTGL